jgi:hypothetical protein
MTERPGVSRRHLLISGGLVVTAPLLGARPALSLARGPAGAGSDTDSGETMAELYWAWQQYEVDAGFDIGEIYEGLVQGMQAHGWADVQQQEDVHGYMPGVDLFAAVVFLYIGGQSFWQVIAVGGGSGTAEQAQQEIQGLQQIISNITFLSRRLGRAF